MARKLTEYKLLSFDVYGTLIDWEAGIWNAFQPIAAKNNDSSLTRHQFMTIYHEFEKKQQATTPDMVYYELLATIHPHICDKLGYQARPTEEESKAFGESVGSWPAFPDTIDALYKLKKFYKLAVLSNVDRQSFNKTNSPEGGSLQGFPFDLILTAQDIGSYKPDLRNFDAMIDIAKEKFGIDKTEILQTAQSQFHDHIPAKEKGLDSFWIDRQGASMGPVEGTQPVYDWRAETLGEMAVMVEKEAEKSK